jgi:transposase
MSSLETEQDIEVLRAMALQIRQELQAKIAALEAENAGFQPFLKENEDLHRQLAKLQRMLFAKSSEKRPPQGGEGASKDATQSGANDQPEEKKKAKQKKRPQKGHGPRPQPALPMDEKVHELDEADKICPRCGGSLKEWEGQFEESEEITIITRQIVCIKHKRKKYRCKCSSCIETAPGPLKLHKGARYSIDFAVDVVFNKYSMQLPLERQVRWLGYDGLIIGSQTLWDYTSRAVELLKPAYDRLLRHQWSMPLLHADETPWLLMEETDQPEGGSKQCYVWSIVSPEAVYHRILESRSEEAGMKVLEGFRGIVMVDGYGVYPALAKAHGFTLVHCWAHVRREFLDIEKSFPGPVGKIVDLLRELFAIEKKCPRGPGGDEQRRALRAMESKAIIEQIHTLATSTPVLPESGLAKAFQYMLNRWTGLTRFLDDPQIPLDNNAAERALRAVVVGRKNHYGSHSKKGLLAASVLYSLIDTAVLEGLNPREYLRMAIVRALSGEVVPLPHEVAAELRSRQTEAMAA